MPVSAVLLTAVLLTMVLGIGMGLGTTLRAEAQVQAHSTAPSLKAPARVGRRERPVAARWSGGWGREFDQLGVEACRSPQARDCRMLGGGELGCPDSSSSPRIGAWYSGWYLFALDARTPADEACAGTAYGSNADLPLWPVGPTISRSERAWRVSGPHRPRVMILRHARIHDQRLLVARVQCEARCPVQISVDTATTGAFRHSGGGWSTTGRSQMERGAVGAEAARDGSRRRQPGAQGRLRAVDIGATPTCGPGERLSPGRTHVLIPAVRQATAAGTSSLWSSCSSSEWSSVLASRRSRACSGVSRKCSAK